MPADMTLYFDVVKQIQDQINRITYAYPLSEQERMIAMRGQRGPRRTDRGIGRAVRASGRTIPTDLARVVDQDQACP